MTTTTGATTSVDVTCTNPGCSARVELTFDVSNVGQTSHVQPQWFRCPCCRQVNNTDFPERLIAVAPKDESDCRFK